MQASKTTTQPTKGRKGPQHPKNVNFRCPEDLWVWVKVEAAKSGTTAQEIVTHALEEYRDRRGKKGVAA